MGGKYHGLNKGRNRNAQAGTRYLADGGYGRYLRTPWCRSTYFRDSITCPNVCELEKVHPCSDCFLIDYVHPKYRDLEIPCHFIPLNEAGDSIASLQSRKYRQVGRSSSRVARHDHSTSGEREGTKRSRLENFSGRSAPRLGPGPTFDISDRGRGPLRFLPPGKKPENGDS